MKSKSNMYINGKTADQITILNLTQVYADYFRLKEFNDRLATSNSKIYHTEDYMYNVRLIDSLSYILEFFGETVVKDDKNMKQDTNQYKSNMYIDWETSDRITISNLRQIYNNITEFNDSISTKQAEKPSKQYAEEYMYNMRLLDSIKVVIEYFGEDV